jgi:hypothetical protein
LQSDLFIFCDFFIFLASPAAVSGILHAGALGEK